MICIFLWNETANESCSRTKLDVLVLRRQLESNATMFLQQ